LVCAYAVWKVRFFENAKVLLLSLGEEEAFDLVSKCRFIDDNLPDYLTSKRDPDQRGFIGFPDTGGEIKALPSTEKAGRSTDATLVVCDEWEFHPYAEQNFAALKPTVDAGGQFIALSTADKTKLNTFFKQKYREAMSGFSNFIHIFLSWKERPGRTDAWLEKIAKDMPPYQVEQEYPSSEKEALSTLKTRKFFDEQSMSYLRLNAREPITTDISDKYPSIRIYKPPVTGKKYLIFTDPSDGKEDPHALIVIDTLNEQQAESHGMVPADRCAEIHDALVKYYNNAFNGFESTGGAGLVMQEKLSEMCTPNVCPSLDNNLKLNPKKTGWWTTKTLWNKAIWNLEESIRLLQFTPHSKDMMDEFDQFIVPEGQDPQKTRGGHDDYIDSVSRVLLLKNYLPAETGEVKSYRPYVRSR